MRRLSILVAGLAIMLVGFVASLDMLADQDRLKQLLSAHAENQLGRQLQIDGDVSLHFFPRLRIQAGDVRLSGSRALDGLDLLSSDRISAEIRLLPLIVGRVETGEVALQGASLNLLFDDNGEHNFSGLLRRRERQGARGLLVNGPLRLEDLSLQIGTVGTESVQRLSVERMELDGLAFDRALRLVFEGDIGIPAMVEDVTVNGVLFFPAATGKFRLADMVLVGRAAGAEQPFRLSGALDFSAHPPLQMQLVDGQLEIVDQRLQIEGSYEARERPYFSLDLRAQALDAARLAQGVAGSGGEDWLAALAGWTAAHDYDLDVQLDRLDLGSWPLADALIRVSAADDLASIEQAGASLPGGTIEVLGDLAVDRQTSLLSARVRIEIDQLESMLVAIGLPLRAEGVGQLLIEPSGDAQSGALARGSLRFFDGRIEELAGLRAALGSVAEAGFEVLEGRFVVYPGRVEFAEFRILEGAEEMEFDRFSLDASGGLSGSAWLSRTGNVEEAVALGGTLARPRYTSADGLLPNR
ncbi:AsmA family protein [Wenzhouxiangella sp. C33]|uniref:AsmA family protein n=1 Tax=Wenzhouxiangella limi TaxID=2707351 RepID=A0A845V2A9_9GAMM|nr:AsmA family protein [Wenzhouxiangella limi]